MNVKLVLLLSALAASAVNCQFDVKNIGDMINQTQHLQDIEKYGKDLTERFTNLYPKLNNSINDGHGFNNQAPNSVVGGTSNSTLPDYTPPKSHLPNNTLQAGGQQGSFNLTERFLNKTISTMPKGFCVKEVPTASLTKAGQVALAGNGSDPTLSRIQVCCEGYQRNVHNFRKCDPICKNECVNGFCSAPDICVCYPDHVRNLGGFCIATCPIMCANGFCNQDNTCRCKDGFAMEPNGKFCVPVCSSGCLYGNCTAPEECTCNKGFSFNSGKKCEPVCSKGCKNGDCVAPDVCNCRQGFTVVNGDCQPSCPNGCSNGVCVAPNVCQCVGDGWSLDSSGSQCIASCDKPCLNGMCAGPNVCSCKAGFALDSLNKFHCVPKCDPPCSNGVCSGPNMCLCSPGFVKDRSVKGSQNCVKS